MSHTYLSDDVQLLAPKDEINPLRHKGCLMTPRQFAEIVILFEKRLLTRPQTKEMIEWCFKTGLEPNILRVILNCHIFDKDWTEGLVEFVLFDNEQMVEQYKSGNKKVLGSLMGITMCYSDGCVHPEVANEILISKLNKETE